MYGGQFGECCTLTMQELCKSAEGLAKMMTVIVTVSEAAGLTVSEKMETMLLRTQDQAPRTSPLVIEAAGRRYRQTTQFFASGRSCQRKSRTTGPTRMGMLQSIQAGAVRYGGCPVHSAGALA